MNRSILKGLNDATLTRQEFDTLPFLDQRDYMESAGARFSRLDTHLDPSHIDWGDRIAANSELGSLLEDYLNHDGRMLGEKETINLLELGSSLGAITTLLSLNVLAKHGLLERVQVWLSDIYGEGLEKTKRLEFDLFALLEACGVDRAYFELISLKISEANIICADIARLPKDLPKFDIVLSGFTHHHLNLENKELACKEMERFAASCAFIGVGDLYFEYDEFIEWLEKHTRERNSKGEKVPYALESFIPVEQHVGLFTESISRLKRKRPKFYAFYLVKNS